MIETTDPQNEQTESESPEQVNPKFKWYVVHTYSGFENRAKQSLEERIRQYRLTDKFGQILIPTENVVEMTKGGVKKTTQRKYFPGYMLVQMELDDSSLHLVKSTPKITGFIGSGKSPPAIPEAEVHRLTREISESRTKAKPRVQFTEGETVKVIAGAFQNFHGVIETVSPDKSKVRVMVSIFGRSTPLELEFMQVEKT